ncbi:hypothetical protein DIPPA_06188 [Diplonema papillatum]|nr:hypothetical protein DIPPA_06188 [Diplonema papillatum]
MLKELYDGSRTERDEASGHESVRRTRILGVDGGIATVTTITTTTGSPSRQSVSPKRIVFAEGHTVMSLPTVRSDSETSSSGTQREVAAALNGVEPEPETYTTTITTAPVSNDPLDTSPHRTPRQRQPPQPWGNAAGIPPSSSLADAILSADLPAAHVPSRRPTKLAAELDGAPVQRPAQFRRESRPEGITPKIGSRDQAAQIGWTGPAPPPQPSAGALSFDVVGEAGVGQLVLYPAASSLRRVPSRDFFDAGPPPKARLAARASPPRQPVLGRALSSPGRLVDRRAARPPQPVAVGRRDTLGSSHGPGSVQDDDYHVWDETVSSSLKSSVRNDPLAERERHRPWRQRSGAALLIPEHAQASKSLMSTPTSGLGLDQGSDSGEHDVTVLIDDQHDVVVLIDDSAAGQTDNNQSLHALPIGSPRLVKFDNSGGRDADGLFPEVQTPCGAVEDIITESAKPSSSLRRPPSRPNGLKTPRTPRGPDCPSPAQSRSPSGAMQRYSTSPSPPFSSSPRSARSVTPPPLRSFGRSAVSPDSPTNEREVAFRNVGGMTLTLTLASDGTVRVSEQEENPDSPRVRNRDPVTQVTLDRCGMLMKVEPAALSFHILPEHEPLLHRVCNRSPVVSSTFN